MRLSDRYALQSYCTTNIGDDIQSVAAAQFLPSIDLLVDRDQIGRPPVGVAGLHKIILNGWYTHAPENWPPAAYLAPLITSFHISREIFPENLGGLNPVETLSRGASLLYLRRHSPIGARDLATRDLLEARGIDSYFSSCLTLTLGNGSRGELGDYICAVDLPELLLGRLCTLLRSHLVIRTHIDPTPGPFAERAYAARWRLSCYAHAKCVVTTRLHCALPCLALGTPVLFIAAARDAYRFSGLTGLLHHCSPQAFLNGVVDFDPENPPANPDDFRDFRRDLIHRVNQFVDGGAADLDCSPFPFLPEPISAELIAPDPLSRSGISIEIRVKRAFQQVFYSGRDYTRDSRPDFLRDLGRVHHATGDLAEAQRLLEFAHQDRPEGSYIEKLLQEVIVRRTDQSVGLEAVPENALPSPHPIVTSVLGKRLTYLSEDRLSSLLLQMSRVKARDVEGHFVEFGVALGGSAVCIASQLDSGRKFYGFDAFEMMPPPGDVDGTSAKERFEIIGSLRAKGIGGDEYYGYKDNLFCIAKENFSAFGLRVDNRRINLIKGKFQEVLSKFEPFSIALAHVDCDWYDQVKYCLEYVHKHLSLFGVVVVDDYNDWEGCRRAVDQFCRSHDDIIMTNSIPHAILVRV